MKKLIHVVILLAIAVVAQVTPAGAVKIERVQSPGGIEAWFVHDTSVPTVTVSFAFEGGASLDPAGREGLADMVSGLLDEGAGDLDSQAFQRAIEDISAGISFDAGRDRFTGSLRTLSAHRDAAFGLMRLALTAPRFDAEPVERIRSQLIAGLKSQEKNPRRIAGRTWMGAMFPDHPYGRPVGGTPKTVKSITPADLAGFVRARFARSGLKIGVVGDIDGNELGRRLDEMFSALPENGRARTVPEAKPPSSGRLIVVRKPIPQSIVIFGQPGVKRHDPDYYALYLLNHAIGGGGFTSRLTEEIREKRGLAYSVYSYLNPMDRAGLIMGGLGTQNARVAKSLSILRDEWRRAAEHGLSDAELDATKTYINGSFPLRLDSSRRIAGLMVAIQVNNLGIDYIERRTALINAVTDEDIRRVARRYLAPEKLTIVVVGDPKGLKSTPVSEDY